VKRYYSIPIGAVGGIPRIRSLYNAPQRAAVAHVRATEGALHIAFAREDLRVTTVGGVVGGNVFTLRMGQAVDFSVRKGQQLFVSMPAFAVSSASVAPYFPEELRGAAGTPAPKTLTLRAGLPTCIVTAPSDRARIVVLYSSGGAIAIGDSPAAVSTTELVSSNYTLPLGTPDTFVVPAGRQLFAVVLGAVPVPISILSADGVVDALTRGI
jgi:hypothetical protein